MAGQTIEGEVVREITLAIDTRYASIVVVPKSDEVNDANMPRNLHNAAELFLRVGMVENAERVKENTGRMLDMYSDNPDGKTNVKIGQGCVCWSCGFCGLPKGGGEEQSSTGREEEQDTENTTRTVRELRGDRSDQLRASDTKRYGRSSVD